MIVLNKKFIPFDQTFEFFSMHKTFGKECGFAVLKKYVKSLLWSVPPLDFTYFFCTFQCLKNMKKASIKNL